MTTRLLRRMLVIALCVTVAAPGCASARLNHAGVPSHQLREPDQGVDPATLADYLKTLPLGKTIRVERVDGRSVRGTLLKVTDRSLTFQEKTRIPEPAIEIPFSEILRVTRRSRTEPTRQDDRHRRRRRRRSGAHRLPDPRSRTSRSVGWGDARRSKIPRIGPTLRAGLTVLYSVPVSARLQARDRRS